VFEGKDGNPRGYLYQAIKKAIDRSGVNDPNFVSEKGRKVAILKVYYVDSS
jgi:hypothetical protein